MQKNKFQDNASLLPFAVLMGGQLFSFIGTTLTGIAVGMWVFQQTGSIVNFSWLLILTLLPAILISPFAGVIADKWHKKSSMLLVDSLGGITATAILYLLWTDQLEIWHLYISAMTNGISLGMQRPLYESTTPLMVPRERLASVNGIVHSVAGIGQLTAPVLAGVLLLNFGLKWVLFIDLASFFIAVFCITLVKVPNVLKPVTENWFAAFAEGYKFVVKQKGLHSMFWFVAFRNYLFATCEVIVLPLLLTITSPDRAGIVLSVGGAGVIVGGLLMSVLGSSRRLITLVFLAQALTGIAMIVGGMTTNLWILATGIAFAFLAFPIEEASSTAIMQRKVPESMMGRVSSVRNILTMGAAPLAMLIAAPLAEKYFEPLMAEDGALSDTAGALIGTGEGRGMALLLVLAGITTLVLTWVGSRYKPLCNVELELPEQGLDKEVVLGGSSNRAAGLC